MGLFEHFPYTNLHTLNLDWILRKMKELTDKVDNIVDVSDEVEDLDERVSDLEETVGGFDDRIDELEQSDGQQDEAIADHEDRLDDLEDAVAGFHGVPAGGASGQVLAKASAADYALAWVNQSGGGGGGSDNVLSFDVSVPSSDVTTIASNDNRCVVSLRLDNYMTAEEQQRLLSWLTNHPSYAYECFAGQGFSGEVDANTGSFPFSLLSTGSWEYSTVVPGRSFLTAGSAQLDLLRYNYYDSNGSVADGTAVAGMSAPQRFYGGSVGVTDSGAIIASLNVPASVGGGANPFGSSPSLNMHFTFVLYSLT